MKTTGYSPVRVGLVGCGNVSRQYLSNVASSGEIDIVMCADSVERNAELVANQFGVASVKTVDDLIGDPEVELVLNLTLPNSHADITLRALAAGKHVYTEKPIAASLSDARKIMATAKQKGLQVGSAPDTFMGAGVGACAELLRQGAIGLPIAVNASVMNAGPDRFHPSPEFLFQPGAGPLFDIGPYYITVLVALLGSVNRVGGLSSMPRTERIIRTGERAGTRFGVGTPTHVTSLLRFTSGVIGSLTTSFDVVGTHTPSLEIHGTEGSIVGPPANSWAGPVLLKNADSVDFVEVPIEERDSPGFMGMGLIEMAHSLRRGQLPAATGARATHVLEVLEAILESGTRSGQFVDISPPGVDLSLIGEGRQVS